MTRLSEIRARLDAAQPEDGPDCGPFRFTPERGPDPHKDAAIWGPDGDQLGTVYGNLALGIDGDALAEMWAHAPQDLAWLLEEVERYDLKDRGKTNEINILTREVRAQETLLRNDHRATEAEAERDALAAIKARAANAAEDISRSTPIARESVPVTVRRSAEDVPVLVAEVERLRAALDDISDGCHCTKPDPWAIGQCDCQTDTARAALDSRLHSLL